MAGWTTIEHSSRILPPSHHRRNQDAAATRREENNQSNTVFVTRTRTKRSGGIRREGEGSLLLPRHCLLTLPHHQHTTHDQHLTVPPGTELALPIAEPEEGGKHNDQHQVLVFGCPTTLGPGSRLPDGWDVTLLCRGAQIRLPPPPPAPDPCDVPPSSSLVSEEEEKERPKKKRQHRDRDKRDKREKKRTKKNRKAAVVVGEEQEVMMMDLGGVKVAGSCELPAGTKIYLLGSWGDEEKAEEGKRRDHVVVPEGGWRLTARVVLRGEVKLGGDDGIDMEMEMGKGMELKGDHDGDGVTATAAGGDGGGTMAEKAEGRRDGQAGYVVVGFPGMEVSTTKKQEGRGNGDGGIDGIGDEGEEDAGCGGEDEGKRASKREGGVEGSKKREGSDDESQYMWAGTIIPSWRFAEVLRPGTLLPKWTSLPAGFVLPAGTVLIGGALLGVVPA